MTDDRPTPTPQAIYHLARLRAGAGDTDQDAIREAWPDCPTSDRDALNAWLQDHPDVTEAVTKVDPEGPPPDAPPLTLLTADEILTTDWPEPVWAIPELLPAGLANFAGKPKLGKSWLALQIAQAVAAGGMVFGRRVERGPVLYLALEDSPKRLKSRMKLQNWPPGLDADFMVIGQFAEEIGSLQNEGAERLAQQIEARAYRLVTIDTFSRAIYGDQLDAEAMTRALTPLHEMANSLNCTVQLVDHHRKGFGTNPDAVADLLGSTAKAAMPDCLWGLYREPGKAAAKLLITGRDIEERTLALTWDRDTGCWQCEGDADTIELTERRQEILDALGDLGRASLKEIADTVGQPKSNTFTRLQDLVGAGLVKRVTDGKRVYYELP